MKPLFEDAGEVEHVLYLIAVDPDFPARLAEMLREHGERIGIRRSIMATPAAISAALDPPRYEPGCDESGRPLDPRHPWRGGQVFGVPKLNTRQEAVLSALIAALEGNRETLGAGLLALHGVEADGLLHVASQKRRRIVEGGRTGGRRSKKKEWALLAAKHYANLSAADAWERLPDIEPDNPNFENWCVWVDRDTDTLCAIHYQTCVNQTPIKRRTWVEKYRAKEKAPK